MADIMIFNNPEFGSIRTIEQNGEPWFVGKDVAEALGYSNASKALSDHVDEQDKLNNESLSSLGQRGGWLINESGLYSLIFSSKLEGAQRFKHWVTSKILPSIRRNGGYIAGQEEMTPTEIMAKAVLLAQKTIADREARIAALTAKNAELTPKAEFADAITASKATILIGNLATVLKQNGCDIGQNRLFRYLRENGYLIAQKSDRYNTPTQRAMDMGLFEVDTSLFTTAYGNAKISYTTRVTPKGQQYFIDKFVKERGVNLMIPEAV